MLETLKNGFLSVIDLLSTLCNLVVSVVSGAVKMFSSLPDVVNSLSAAIEILPTMFVSSAIFCLTVALIVKTVNHKAGES